MSRVVKKSNLCVVTRKYTDQQGQEKSVWKTIGELTTFQKDDGGYNTIAELYTMPGITISVFEQKEKEQTQQVPRQPQQQQQPQYQAPAQTNHAQQMQAGMNMAQNQEPEINVMNIPF